MNEKTIDVVEIKEEDVEALKVFDTLNKVDVSKYIEKKEGGKDKNGKPVLLSYLSWAWAWAEVKKRFPNAEYSIEKFENGLPYVCDENTGYMVFTHVGINGQWHEMWLPVMDNKNNAMKSKPYTYKTKWGEFTVDQATMFDINKTIMRCLVKNLAMFGLGLYIYAGEDLPESDDPKVELPQVDENGVSGKAKEEIAKARAKKEEKKVEPSPKVVEAKPLVDLPTLEESFEKTQVVFNQEDIDDNATISSEDRDVIANLLNKLPMERQIAFLDKYLKVIKGYPSINSIQYKDFGEIKSQLEKAVAQKKA